MLEGAGRGSSRGRVRRSQQPDRGAAGGVPPQPRRDGAARPLAVPHEHGEGLPRPPRAPVPDATGSGRHVGVSGDGGAGHVRAAGPARRPDHDRRLPRPGVACARAGVGVGAPLSAALRGLHRGRSRCRRRGLGSRGERRAVGRDRGPSLARGPVRGVVGMEAGTGPRWPRRAAGDHPVRVAPVGAAPARGGGGAHADAPSRPGHLLFRRGSSLGVLLSRRAAGVDRRRALRQCRPRHRGQRRRVHSRRLPHRPVALPHLRRGRQLGGPGPANLRTGHTRGAAAAPQQQLPAGLRDECPAWGAVPVLRHRGQPRRADRRHRRHRVDPRVVRRRRGRMERLGGRCGGHVLRGPVGVGAVGVAPARLRRAALRAREGRGQVLDRPLRDADKSEETQRRFMLHGTLVTGLLVGSRSSSVGCTTSPRTAARPSPTSCRPSASAPTRRRVGCHWDELSRS